jgi:hypothetical protein
MFYAVLMAMMVSSGVAFGMEKEKESRQALIARLGDKPNGIWACEYEKNGFSIEQAFEDHDRENPSFGQLLYRISGKLHKVVLPQRSFMYIAREVKSLAKTDKDWKKILDGEYNTKCLLRMIEKIRTEDEERFSRDADECERAVYSEGIYINEEIAAAILGTPGAIALGKKCIMIHENKERLLDFVLSGGGGQCYEETVQDSLQLSGQALDIARAAVAMGIDPQDSMFDLELTQNNNQSFLMLLGGEYRALEKIIKEQHAFERIVFEIKSLAQKNIKWKQVLDSEYHTKSLLRIISKKKPGINTLGYDRQLCGSGWYLNEILTTVILGTPGAIELGKKYSMIPENKKELIEFVFNIAGSQEIRWGKVVEGLFVWPDEDFDVVQAGIAMGIDPHQDRSGFGYPLLVRAAEANKIKMVKYFLDAGVDIESALIYSTTDYPSKQKYTEKLTALLIATQQGNETVVDLLLQRGANINVTDGLGRTPLVFAAKHGYVRIVEKLLDARAVAGLCDAHGQCAFDYAAERFSKASEQDKEKYEKIIELLEHAK